MTYFISAGLKTLSFFLILPIATHLLPKAEVGKFFFWIAIVQLGAGITTAGFSSAVARRAYNLRATDYIAGAGLLVALLGWIMVALFGVTTSLVPVAVLLAWIVRSFSLIGEARTIARSEIRKLSVLYALYAVAFPVLAYLLVVHWRPGYESLLLAFLAAEAIVVVGGLYTLRAGARSATSVLGQRFWSAARKAGTYGLPIMIAGLANMGLNSADRFIVAGFWDFEVVAEFSVMYTIAFASSRFITSPANMKIFPEFVRGHRDAAVVARIRNVSGMAWLTSAMYCAFIAVAGPWIVRTVLSAEYDLQSADFALVSAASAMFLLFTINSSHLKLQNRTATVMLALFTALALSVSISLALVPVLGYRGASISTFCTYAALGTWALIRLRPALFNSAALAGGAAVMAIALIWALAL